MKLIYIAGPFRGETPYEVHANVFSAEAEALKIAKSDMIPVIPHTMYAHFDKSLLDQFWLEATAEILKRCDAVFLCPGWQKPKGTQAEFEIAKQEGIPIFSDRSELIRWAEWKEKGWL